MTTCRLPILPALCCSLLVLSVFPGSTESASCCVRYSKNELYCKGLNSYTLQTIYGSCDIPAVIFHGPKRLVCADPSRKRTRHVRQCVDKKRNNRFARRRS